jgi:cytochrome P450
MRHAVFDPLDPDLVHDPYPAYARLRQQAGPRYLESHDIWLVTRYADVLAVLRDPQVFSSDVGTTVGADTGAGRRLDRGIRYRIGAPGVRVLISSDPPEHQMFRKAVAEAFSARAIAALAPTIDAIARDLVDQLVEKAGDGTAEFFADVAEPLPVLVLAEMFGVPADMRSEFRRWSRNVTADLEGDDDGGGLGRGLEMFRYFRREIQARRRESRSDLLGLLAGADQAGLSDHEVLAFCAFLLVAGIETTTNLLTNLLDALMRHPEQQRRLRAERDLVPSAIEEGLRYDSPVQALWRGTTRSVAIDGVNVPGEARLLVVFGSANRDERRFAHADRFEVARRPNDHLAFGHGNHFCLGARLARREVSSLLTHLLDRTREVTPRGSSARLNSIVLRGFVRQDVGVVPA